MTEKKPKQINIRVSGHVYEKVDELVRSGKFSTPADVAKTALIEWLRDRELKTVYEGRGKFE
jgi:Arc/MetJ-type ribon-helix-helix transcriptional regulator